MRNLPESDFDTAKVMYELQRDGIVCSHWCEIRKQTVFRLTDEGRQLARQLIRELTFEWNRGDTNNDGFTEQSESDCGAATEPIDGADPGNPGQRRFGL